MDVRKRGPITPRERVKVALRHQESDRVPFDFWAVPEVCAALRQRLGVETDEEVLRRLGHSPPQGVQFVRQHLRRVCQFPFGRGTDRGRGRDLGWLGHT